MRSRWSRDAQRSVLVVGSTGFLGSEIVRQLAKTSFNVRALVRPGTSDEKLARLRDWGAELALGDLKDVSSLERACEEIATVISTASSTLSRRDGDSIQTVDLDGQLALLRMAAQRRVERFLFFSTLPNPNDFPLQRAKRTVEHQVCQSGFAYTVLRPASIFEVWLSPMVGFAPHEGRVRVFGGGERKTSWVSLADVARFAVAAASGGAFHNQIVHIGGPEALSYRELITLWQDRFKRKLEVEYLPEEALEQQFACARDELERSLAALMLQTARGDVVDMAPALELLPGELRSVRDYLFHELR